MKNINGWIIFAGLNGFIAVAFGAVGAHAIADAYLSGLVERASQYQLIHAAVLLYLASHNGGFVRVARWLFALGIVLFCGALYVKGLTGWMHASQPAPTGGVSFMLGWLMLAFGGWKAKGKR